MSTARLRIGPTLPCPRMLAFVALALALVFTDALLGLRPA